VAEQRPVQQAVRTSLAGRLASRLWVLKYQDFERYLVNLNSGLRPKLSCLVSVCGLSERLIFYILILFSKKWNNPMSFTLPDSELATSLVKLQALV